MNFQELIEKKRDGKTLSRDEIENLVQGIVSGEAAMENIDIPSFNTLDELKKKVDDLSQKVDELMNDKK
jgi:thymidine phosphorylase